jgi:hypothetical protein
MNEPDQQAYAKGLALRDAAKSEAGQLYHKLVKGILDDDFAILMTLGVETPDAVIAAHVHRMQGVYRCLVAEGDAVHKGLQVGARLMEKARVGVR